MCEECRNKDPRVSIGFCHRLGWLGRFGVPQDSKRRTGARRIWGSCGLELGTSLEARAHQSLSTPAVSSNQEKRAWMEYSGSAGRDSRRPEPDFISVPLTPLQAARRGTAIQPFTQKDLLVGPLSLTLPFAFVLAGCLLRLTVKDEVSVLESVELRRPRHDAEAFGNDTSALPFVGLVCLYDLVVRIPAHVAELKAHEGVSGRADLLDNGLHLGQGNTELGAQLDAIAVHVGPGLDVKVIEKRLESSSGPRQAAKEDEHDCRQDTFPHTDPFFFVTKSSLLANHE